MKFAIIAAGDGSRLVNEGIKESKPLVRLGNETMIDRLIHIFTDAGASEIVIIINSKMQDVAAHMKKVVDSRVAEGLCPIKLLVKSTPSSMHSFFEISTYLESEPFCLTTVDTIFRKKDFLTYIDAFKKTSYDGMMAVTDYIDDEKPLYVGTDENMNITGFYDESQNCKYISGGIYCLKPLALSILRHCMKNGMSRMRNFQRQLVAEQFKLCAFAFPKILDVDHADDILKAEEFLKTTV